jgi:hypothetical protein
VLRQLSPARMKAVPQQKAGKVAPVKSSAALLDILFCHADSLPRSIPLYLLQRDWSCGRGARFEFEDDRLRLVAVPFAL